MEDQLPSPSSNIRGPSFFNTCFNVLNAMIGIGLITTPYTLAQAGWLSLTLLTAMGIITCYTGVLLQRCMDSNPALKTYPDIGLYAFGRKVKILISIFLFLELYLVPTGFLILEGDNLHKLFPHVGFKKNGHTVEGKRFFTIAATLVILPTMWLKDFSMLSWVSATGVLSSAIIMFSILFVGAIDGVGFSRKGKLFNLGGVPIALSLYAFCFGVHSMFPTFYSSMSDKGRFSKVVAVCFSLATFSYVLMAIIGYLMFGENVQSQVTLNLPTGKLGSKIAIYTLLVGPIVKYALIISPIAIAIEKQLPGKYNTWLITSLLRTLLLLSSLVVALVFPYFGTFVALVGAILTVTLSILLPCSCYLKISGAYRKWGFETVIVGAIIFFGVLVGVLGTYSSIKEVVK